MTPSDIAVDSTQSPLMVQVRHQKSKTDQEGKGMLIYVGKTNDVLLAISNLCDFNLCDFTLCSIKLLMQKLIMKMSSLVHHKKAQSLPFQTKFVLCKSG